MFRVFASWALTLQILNTCRAEADDSGGTKFTCLQQLNAVISCNAQCLLYLIVAKFVPLLPQVTAATTLFACASFYTTRYLANVLNNVP